MSTSSALVASSAALPPPEEDAELPVDLSQLPSIPAAKSLLLINNFVANTTRFLNHFAHECEERITRVSDNVTRVEILLAILEAKLNSIPDLSVSDAEVKAATGDDLNLSQNLMDLGISDQDLPSMETAAANGMPPPPPPEEEGVSIEGRFDSRRRSSVTASIMEDVSKFKLTVSRMFEKASQIKLDEERSARVAELVDSEVMVLNASQLAQSQQHVIYLIEMVLNFFTSYEDDATGEEIKDLDKVRLNYVKSWFLVDAVTRVAKVSDSGLVRTVSGHIDRSMNPSMLRMLKLTVIFLVSQHLIACTYYYISLNQSVETTWAPTHEIRSSDSLGQQYVDAFYFAIMVTTANDVNPTTPIEKLFTSVMLFVGIVINASIIGSAANLLANLDKEEIARKNQMDSINDYLRFKKVPLNLQNKIRRYYDYALTTRLQDPTETLFADLPDRLKLLLKLNLHSEFVRKVPLFRALSHSGVVAIIQCLAPVVAMPGEIIIVCGEVASEFYFIKTGQVSLCVPGLVDSIPLGNLGEGSFFGETSLLTGEPTTAEVKAERMCELMYLDKDDFEAIVDRFPTFFLAVRRISESRMQTAQNIQKMSKMNRRPTQILKIKKISFRSVAQAAKR
uniref:Cyclic nucleotide-binding domain-containing protein n=1 Tax=Phytophthora ramorum TaxID=164328 RepID=H3H3Q4_PHYRM